MEGTGEAPRAPFLHEPTREEMVAFLASVTSLDGLDLVEYVDFCKPLKQSQKIGDGQYRDIWQPYFLVDGRLLMCARYHQKNNASYEVECTELERTEKRILVVAIVRSTILGAGVGRASAHLDATSGAESTHPEEVAETSAIGRALATLGFGILPGAGLASAEDMKTAKERGAEGATGIACPECGKGIVVERKGTNQKTGKAYHFWGCNQYPACEYKTNKEPSSPAPEDEAPPAEEPPPDEPPAEDPPAKGEQPDPPEPKPPSEEQWQSATKLRNRAHKVGLDVDLPEKAGTTVAMLKEWHTALMTQVQAAEKAQK